MSSFTCDNLCQKLGSTDELKGEYCKIFEPSAWDIAFIPSKTLSNHKVPYTLSNHVVTITKNETIFLIVEVPKYRETDY
jgi:hypothetical protein